MNETQPASINYIYRQTYLISFKFSQKMTPWFRKIARDQAYMISYYYKYYLFSTNQLYMMFSTSRSNRWNGGEAKDF